MPKTDDELMSSLTFSDHYFDSATLNGIGQAIKEGRTPILPEETKSALRPSIEEFRRMTGITSDSDPLRTAQKIVGPNKPAIARSQAVHQESTHPQHPIWIRFYRIKSWQWMITAISVVAVGGMQAYQATSYHHPIAVRLGALTPAIIFSPLTYWMYGWILRRRYFRSRSSERKWQNFLSNDPGIAAAVERLSSLSSRNVEEFRFMLLFMLNKRTPFTIKQMEDEAIRRIQGVNFVGNAALQKAYIDLKNKSQSLADELVRVVRLTGKPKDLNQTVAQICILAGFRKAR
jgi:hypothetical protein